MSSMNKMHAYSCENNIKYGLHEIYRLWQTNFTGSNSRYKQPKDPGIPKDGKMF